MKQTLFGHVDGNTFKLLSESTIAQRGKVINAAEKIAKKKWGKDVVVHFSTMSSTTYDFEVELPSKPSTGPSLGDPSTWSSLKGPGDPMYNAMMAGSEQKPEQKSVWLRYDTSTAEWSWSKTYSGSPRYSLV